MGVGNGLIIFLVIQDALKEIKILEEGVQEINMLIKKMAAYFCEDEQKIKLQEVLNLFKTFCDQLTTAKKVLPIVFGQSVSHSVVKCYDKLYNVE